MRFSFGSFLFDTGTRELLAGGKPVHLTPKAFRLLQILLDERPLVLRKEDLLQRIWPDTFITETNLATLVAELREALADDPRHPRYLRTVHRVGYAFCGEAVLLPPAVGGKVGRQPSPGIHHRLYVGDREVSLLPGDNVLGRDPLVSVWVDDPSVSRRHARIAISGESATLEDLRSKNGTTLRGAPVRGPATPLADGDEIRLGNASLVYRALALPTSTMTAHGE